MFRLFRCSDVRTGPMIAAVLLAFLAPDARGQNLPPGYEVVQITDTPWREGSVDLNNRGQIVYMARLAGTLESQEIFLYDDRTGETTRITDDGYQDVGPEINDDGVIVWYRVLEFAEVSNIMMRTPDGVVSTFFSSGGFNRHQEINNLGQIAWSRSNGTGCGNNGQGLMFYDGQAIRTIVDNEWFNQGPRLNERGEVVWTEYNICPGGANWLGLIKLYADGQVLTLSEPGWQSQSCDINDDRTVVWSSGYPVVDAGIYFVDVPFDVWVRDGADIEFQHDFNSTGSLTMDTPSPNGVAPTAIVRDGNKVYFAPAP